MKKMMNPANRILSILLVLAMLLGLMPVTAFAAGSTFSVDDLTYTVLTEPSGDTPGTVSLTSGTSTGGAVTIPETVTNSGKNYTVTDIGSNAFLNCTALTSIVIADSVTSIGDGAFQDCYKESDGVGTGLSSVTLPAGLTSVGKDAFAGCKLLTTVDIPHLTAGSPKAVLTIGTNAFVDTTIRFTGGTMDVTGIDHAKSVVITGGSINILGLDSPFTPTNADGTAVYLNTVTVQNFSGTKQTWLEVLGLFSGSNVETAVENYGCDGLMTDSAGKLYLWLPEGETLQTCLTESRSGAFFDQWQYTDGDSATENDSFTTKAAASEIVFLPYLKPGSSFPITVEVWGYPNAQGFVYAQGTSLSAGSASVNVGIKETTYYLMIDSDSTTPGVNPLPDGFPLVGLYFNETPPTDGSYSVSDVFTIGSTSWTEGGVWYGGPTYQFTMPAEAVHIVAMIQSDLLPQATNPTVTVNGVTMLSAQYLPSGADSAEDLTRERPEGGYAYLYNDNGTLTLELNDASFENGGLQLSANAPGSILTIKLTGTNTLAGAGTTGSAGIFDSYEDSNYGGTDMTFTGTGSLTATGGEVTTEGAISAGICGGGNITIENNVTIVATGGITAGENSSYGIRAAGDVTLAGNVTAIGRDFGIMSAVVGNINIIAGRMIASGGTRALQPGELGGIVNCHIETVRAGDSAETALPVSVEDLTQYKYVQAPSDCIVSFNANGGTGTMDSVAVNAGDTYTLPENGFTAPEGYQFKAWSVNGTEYQPGAEITVAAHTTVTAVWEVGTFDIYVKYVSTGEHIQLNVKATDTISEVKSKIFNLKAIPVGKQTLVFAGTTLEDDKTLFDYNIQKDTTIHLIVKHTVTFDANGGTGEMESQTVTEGETYTLPENGFTAPEGYQFKGWATSADGAVIEGGTITVLTDTTLYAIWDASIALIITGGVEGTDYTYENGVLDIIKAGTYEIRNADPTGAVGDIIKVSAPEGTVNITLAGVVINVSGTGSFEGSGTAAFEITGACTTKLILKDGAANSLDSGVNRAGIANHSHNLIITCEHAEETDHLCGSDCGSLRAIGQARGAGIGGDNGEAGSNITITGGNVTADIVSSWGGAGIGGGVSGNGSNITISGGIVTATGGDGAGIGGGDGGSGSNITISGGTVTATSDWGAGIGGGYLGSGSNITISGGTVTATSSSREGIGGGIVGGSENIKVAPAANTEILVNTGATAAEAEELTYSFTEEVDITELVSGNAYFYSEAKSISAGEQKYTFTIVNGALSSGITSGTSEKDYWIQIYANEPPEGMRFKEWTWTGVETLEFTNASTATSNPATFVMPAADVTVTAVYEAIPTEADVYVGGVGMTDGDYLANGAAATTTTAPTSGGYAHYANGVLTLNNYAYEGEGYVYDTNNGYSSAIYAPAGLAIVLQGENSITNTSIDSDGITPEAGLTISGSGSLAINADYGIYAWDGNVTINGGSLDITVEFDGIYTEEGYLTVNGGSLDITSGRDGIYAWDGNVTINGGTLDITAETGIYADYGSISVNDGTLDITAAVGIVANDGSVSFNGGRTTVDARVEGGIAVIAYDGITFTGVEILEPEGAEVKTHTYDDGYTYHVIFDADGNFNIRVVIGTRGPTVCDECVDENRDHLCDVCQTELSKCVDEDKDHLCDICETELSKCVDEDKDHLCDICETELSKCADEDKDHKCDACEKVISECVDENKDYKCDICGAELEKPDSVIRLAGAHRWETAIKVADEMKANLGVEKFDTIIIASGNDFADALAGSYLSTVKSAPILLSWGQGGKYEYLDTDNIEYIKENLAENGTVYILGGTAAVPESYETALSDYNVERLGGANRFETNLLILKEAGVNKGDEILVCTSTNFADSLSASATGKPILLVFNNYKALYGEQPEYLATLEDCTFTIVGGESAVCAELETAVKAFGETTRLAGENRFETSVMVAEKYFDAPETAVLAYAWNYPDGLCGGALAYSMDAPLILTMTKYEAEAVEYATENTITSGVVLGGDGLISDDAVRSVFGMEAADEIIVK